MDRLVGQITEVVRKCGSFILQADRKNSHVVSKEGHANFVTEYDKKVQEMLKGELLAILPEAFFVGEEENIHSRVDTGYAFVVDPIDGTTNFIKDYRASSISVGLLKDGRQYIGVVYNPYMYMDCSCVSI